MEEIERRIREEIRREGSISFARFMERALLEPGLGYYATPERRAGRSGDFMTAPELHPILGAAIAQLAAAAWERLGRPTTFRWREHGAGEGTLLLAALDYLARAGHPLLGALEVSVTEANPHRLDDLAAALSRRPGGGPRLVAAGSPPVAGIVVARWSCKHSTRIIMRFGQRPNMISCGLRRKNYPSVSFTTIRRLVA